MAQKEIWFTCPLCARPIRVSGKFIGAEFVHPACGATVLAPDPAKGRAEGELISAPDITAGGDVKKVKLEKFEKFESRGLFVPRRLREMGGEEPPEAVAESPAPDDDVHVLAEKIARALIEKEGAAVEGTSGEDEDPDDGEFGDLDFDGEFSAEIADVPIPPAKPPLSEKVSVLGTGRKPVDPDKLKKQFSKSLDILKDDEAEVGMLEGKAPLSAQRQDYVVQSVTPWEADDGGPADAGVPAPVPQHGSSRAVFLVVALVVLVICALLVTRSLTKRETGGDDPSDVPIRGTIRD